MRKIKLFCFPFAGGSSLYYRDWQKHLDSSIELRAIEVAGRGRRISDPLYRDLPEMIEDLFAIIAPELDQQPYLFFGHSMGGVIAHELTLKIQQENYPPPMHLFISGRNAPHLKPQHREVSYYDLPAEEFKKQVLKLGGAPIELFEEPGLADLFLPMLRNDFRLAETYLSHEEIKCFDFSISILVGKEEPYTSEEIASWHKYTSKICSIHYFPGGHFFLTPYQAEVVALINEQVAKLLSTSVTLTI